MTEISRIIAYVLSLAAAIATMGIGAYLLRNAVKDASDISSMLPTRSLKEDTNESRDANRRKALSEIVLLLAVRSGPGAVLVIFAAGLLVWICCGFLPVFRTD